MGHSNSSDLLIELIYIHSLTSHLLIEYACRMNISMLRLLTIKYRVELSPMFFLPTCMEKTHQAILCVLNFRNINFTCRTAMILFFYPTNTLWVKCRNQGHILLDFMLPLASINVLKNYPKHYHFLNRDESGK